MPSPPLSREVRAWAHTSLNPLTAAAEAARREGRDIIDLVGAVAHENGLGVPEVTVRQLAAEAAPTAGRFHPDPRGQVAAREAVAAFYTRRGVPTDARDIVLTPGTSMAYLYVLRLLLERGDEVLVPQPGYPLFDDLCTFAGVRQRFYHLRPGAGRWHLDLDDLAFQITPRTRAIMVVSPHNPLGLVLSAPELEAVAALCERNGLALVFDEVFSEFVSHPLLPRPPAGAAGLLPRPPAGASGPLTILLNGLSKMLSLPGLKLGWMRVSPSGAALLDALEYASDLFLPVSEISQAMTAPLLAQADAVSAASAAEIAHRRACAVAALGRPALDADGGVYVCVPVDGDDDAIALCALDAGVLVHPGHFYALEGHIVFTCIAQTETLIEGVRRLSTVLA